MLEGEDVLYSRPSSQVTVVRKMLGLGHLQSVGAPFSYPSVCQGSVELQSSGVSVTVMKHSDQKHPGEE